MTVLYSLTFHEHMHATKINLYIEIAIQEYLQSLYIILLLHKVCVNPKIEYTELQLNLNLDEKTRLAAVSVYDQFL